MNTLLHYAQTDTGRQRTNNEDNLVNLASTDGRYVLLGAIDGMGGYEGGEVAAAILRQSLEQSFAQSQGLLHPTPQSLMDSLRQWIIVGNNAILDTATAQPQYHLMGCVATITLIDVQAEQLYYAHVGDSRGYVYRQGQLSKFTHDHSPVGRLEDEGALLEADAMRHPRRNEVDRNLGHKYLEATDSSHIEVGSHSFYAGDTVLLCSDGLTDLVNRETLIAKLGQTIPLERIAQQLIDSANELGGKDNITVALATVQNDEQQSQVTPSADLMIEEVTIVTSANSSNKRSTNKTTKNKTKATPKPKVGSTRKISDSTTPPAKGTLSNSRIWSLTLLGIGLVVGVVVGTCYGQTVVDALTPAPVSDSLSNPLPTPPITSDVVRDSVLISTYDKMEYDSLKALYVDSMDTTKAIN